MLDIGSDIAAFFVKTVKTTFALNSGNVIGHHYRRNAHQDYHQDRADQGAAPSHLIALSLNRTALLARPPSAALRT